MKKSYTSKRMKKTYNVSSPKRKECPKIKGKGSAKAPGTIKRGSMKR